MLKENKESTGKSRVSRELKVFMVEKRLLRMHPLAEEKIHRLEKGLNNGHRKRIERALDSDMTIIKEAIKGALFIIDYRQWRWA